MQYLQTASRVGNERSSLSGWLPSFDIILKDLLSLLCALVVGSMPMLYRDPVCEELQRHFPELLYLRAVSSMGFSKYCCYEYFETGFLLRIWKSHWKESPRKSNARPECIRSVENSQATIFPPLLHPSVSAHLAPCACQHLQEVFEDTPPFM